MPNRDSGPKPIRVLQIITRMNVGGPAIEIDRLMKSMNKEIFTSLLITGVCESNEIDFLKTRCVDYNFTTVTSIKRSIAPLSDFVSILKLIKIIKECRPHIVHTHTAKAGLLGRIATRLVSKRISIVHTYHGHVLEGYFNKPVEYLFRFLEKNLGKFTERIIVVGGSILEQLLTYKIGTRHKYSVIHPGVDIPKILEKSPMRIDATAFNLAFVGRLTHIKRVDRLLYAVKEASTGLTEKKIVLHIIGDGELRNTLETLSKDLGINVIFHGWQENPFSIVSRMDCVIITSDNEGTPISLIEAGLLGKPTIGTNVGAVEEVIIHQRTGLLCVPEVSEISSAILTLLEDKSICKQYGQAAKKHLKKEFSVESFLHKHQALYIEIVNSKVP